jgi:glycosyltransferase involved in cell wall biosynthesis
MKKWIAKLPAPLPDLARQVYRRLRRGSVGAASGPAAAAGYRLADWPEAVRLGPSFVVELHLDAGRVSAAAAAAFLAGQTLGELRILGWNSDGGLAYQLGAAAGPVFFFLAPGDLPTVPAAFAEALLLIFCAEAVDAVVLADRDAGLAEPHQAAEVLATPSRKRAAFAPAAFRFEPAGFRVEPKTGSWLAKLLADEPPMGRYLSSTGDGGLAVGVRPASRLARRPVAGRRPRLLVSVPFFARGGVEHTLYETLRHLGDRYEPIFLGLAPHSAELGDRRADFEELGPRLFSLGDWLHPAAMAEVIEQLVLTYRPFAWYNANGTTLFYDLAPRIKARFPELRILDHLYDHRVGYIEWYRPAPLGAIDACIAENGRIAATLAEEYGWPLERSPVVWPCGRRDEDWPPRENWEALRQAKRRELGLPPEAKVLLVAARMHAQKRPLDLPALALLTKDLPVFILIAGGGPLEAEVDAAIANATAQGAAIRRLPFRKDIPELILAADAGCLVSDYEGLPIFLMECLQAGRPFLGTDVGALGDLLRETGAGWIVERPGDLDALAAAVAEICDPAIYQDRRAKALAAGSRFGVGPCAENYAAAFEGKSPA